MNKTILAILVLVTFMLGMFAGILFTHYNAEKRLLVINKAVGAYVTSNQCHSQK